MIKFGFHAQDVVGKGLITWDEIDLIKQWLETRPDLPRYTDEQLVSFHLACDKNEKETKKTIIAFHTIRNKTPQLFSKRSMADPKVEKALTVANFSLLPLRTPDGCVVFFSKLINMNYLDYDNVEYLKILLMMMDAAIYDYPPTGCILIIDMDGMSIKHSTKFKFNAIRSCANYLQCGLPAKLKSFHLLNSSLIVEKLIAMIKPFLTDHVISLIVTHRRNELDAFREKYVSGQYLPKDLGGDLPSLDTINQETTEKLRSLQSHFNDEERQRSEVNML